MRLRSRSTSTLVAAALALACAGVQAGAATLTADYGIWLSGLPIGRADISSSFDGERYKLDVQARLTGLAGLLTGGKGAATAAGAVVNGRVVPSFFAVTSRSSSEQRTVRMGLDGGNVAAVDITPPVDDKPDRIPVTDAHRRGVVDPVSALLMPVEGRGDPADPENCNRTIPVFDGASRFNVILSYAETKAVDKPGYRGPVLVCRVRWVPIAGHRPERRTVRFMVENEDMSVWLAPVEATRVLVPLRIAVKTMVGMSVIEASHWRLDGGATAAAPRRAVRARN